MTDYAEKLLPVLVCRDDQVLSRKRFEGDKPIGEVTDILGDLIQRGAKAAIVFNINGLFDYELAVRMVWEGLELTIGGGIQDMDDAGQMLRAGAAKVALNTGLVHSNLLSDASEKWPGQISAVVNVRKGVVTQDNGKLELVSVSPAVWAHRLQTRGASEIILQSMDTDGDKYAGYDHKLLREVVNTIDIPVCAVGNCVDVHDTLNAYFLSGASSIGLRELHGEHCITIADLARQFVNRDFSCES